ncbi:DUF6907 domain-containing protein [Actinacidiphila paucisporea]|uniref:Uncharacterized protein n=1 Tax=Actinacidiphila paucisporea TaxID=310782 RepID=A0A1M6TJ97_9ACTN|nr:hypothetical protein [Actinacidiphila paucisporea]SHK57061.1 hypothetical protein SAMN05216499_10165 [Actinacidiphila paucisporea]
MSRTTATDDLGRSVPEVPAPRRWTVATTEGFTVTGHLLAWADDDPTATGVPPGQLAVQLADISHRAYFDGELLHVIAPGREPQEGVLWGVLVCDPYAEDPAPRVPVVNIAVVDDYWINHLDPAGLAEVAARLRAQADRLDHDVRPRLVAARADWAARHGA